MSADDLANSQPQCLPFAVRVADSEMTMAERFRNLLVYTAILATMLAGVVHMSFWAALAGASLLAALGLHGRDSAIAAGRPGMMLGSELTQLFACILNAATIASAAFAFGRLLAWFWGV
jgi:hypothetical protein